MSYVKAEVGNTLTTRCVFTREDTGDAWVPDEVSVTIADQDGVETTFRYGTDAQVEQNPEATNEFFMRVPITATGFWRATWAGIGEVTAVDSARAQATAH